MRSLGWVWVLGCEDSDKGTLESEASRPDSAFISLGDTGPPPEPDADEDGSPDRLDCDDQDPLVYPGAPDPCDGRVTDCDRGTELGLVTIAGGETYDDLALALAAALPGDELIVCPGIYTGGFVADGVTLTGLEGWQATMLRASGESTVLQTTGDTLLRGLTLAGGRAEQGGGIWHQGPGHLALVDCMLQYNRADRGGGLAMRGGSLSLSDTTVTGNEALEGGGIHAVEAALDLGLSSVYANRATASGGGLWLQDSELVGGSLVGNEAFASGYGYYSGYLLSEAPGGGLYAVGTVTVAGTELWDNAARYGGGVYAAIDADQDCQLALQDVEIHHNEAYGPFGAGGGLYATSCALSLKGATEIASNEAGAFGGGGVVLSNSVMVGGTVRDNVSGWKGGGILLWGSTLASVQVTGNTAVEGGGLAVGGNSTLQEVVVEGNAAARGGGVSLVDTLWSPVRWMGGRASDNEAEQGGGLYARVLTASLEGVELSDNGALEGAGLYLVDGTLSLQSSAILRNAATSGGGAQIAGGRLFSRGSDWGAGVDDNRPNDVETRTEVAGYGPAATFSCDSEGCAPLPP